jgi:hypothetical protein
VVESLGEQLIWGYQGAEESGAKGGGREEIEVHTKGWELGGLKWEAWEEGKCDTVIITNFKFRCCILRN